MARCTSVRYNWATLYTYGYKRIHNSVLWCRIIMQMSNDIIPTWGQSYKLKNLNTKSMSLQMSHWKRHTPDTKN